MQKKGVTRRKGSEKGVTEERGQVVTNDIEMSFVTT